MAPSESQPLAAVDIGNSRIKLGLFDPPNVEGEQWDRVLLSKTDTHVVLGELTAPSRWLLLETDEWDPLEIALWLAPLAPSQVAWRIGSVHRGAAAKLRQWLEHEGAAAVAELTHQDLPLIVDLPAPEQVGIDRLLGAVAANVLRSPNEPVIVIDVGSALTVDVVSPLGTFCGGAILPGVGMSARALHEFTDLLPNLDISTLGQEPPTLGTSTQDAIASGLFWGAVGAMRILIERFAAELGQTPLVLLTGGAAEGVAPLLGQRVRYEPHLILSGIALCGAGE